LARSGPEARALRDIYSFVRVRNVIETQDCGCAGKVANWEEVEAVAAACAIGTTSSVLSWQQTKRLRKRPQEAVRDRRNHVWRQLLMDSVSTILTTLDAAITSAGRQYFEATAGAVGPIYTTLLALLLVMVGINAALNVYRISMRDAVQLSFRIVMVLMFGLTWSNFTQIYEAASNGLSALALEYFRLGGGGVGASATAAMDDMANMMAGNVDSVSSAMSSIMRGFVAAVLYVVLGVLMAVYVFIVGFSKLMIAFLLGVAPIAIGATIFEKTKGMFEAWLSAMIGYLMYPVASAGVIVAVVTVAHDVFAKREDVTDLGSILGFFVIVFRRASLP
jgi:type IV secretion system protein VirB6